MYVYTRHSHTRFPLLRRMEGVETNKRKSFEIDAPPPPSNGELVKEEEKFESNLERHRTLKNKATPEYARQLRKEIKNQNVRIKLDRGGARMNPSINVTILRHLPSEEYQALLDVVFRDTIEGGKRRDGGLVKVSFNPSSVSDARMASDEEREKQKEKDKLSSQSQRNMHFAQGEGTLSRKEWKAMKGGAKVCFKDDTYEVTCLDVKGERLFELYVDDYLEQTSSAPRFILKGDKDYNGKCILVGVWTRTNGIEDTPSYAGAPPSYSWARA